MKKIIAAFALSTVLLAAVPLTASAHGHGHNSACSGTAATNYSLCSAENCNVSGNHQHDGITYAGHYMGDGHDYHQACMEKGCTETGSHDHNGNVCRLITEMVPVPIIRKTIINIMGNPNDIY